MNLAHRPFSLYSTHKPGWPRRNWIFYKLRSAIKSPPPVSDTLQEHFWDRITSKSPNLCTNRGQLERVALSEDTAHLAALQHIVGLFQNRRRGSSGKAMAS